MYGIFPIIYLPASSKWPFDSPTGGHLQPWKGHLWIQTRSLWRTWYIWLEFMVNVGKYTSPMDPMGFEDVHTRWTERLDPENSTWKRRSNKPPNFWLQKPIVFQGCISCWWFHISLFIEEGIQDGGFKRSCLLLCGDDDPIWLEYFAQMLGMVWSQAVNAK